MELDPLTPSGYFSEFSWHSLDDDEAREMSAAPYDDMQMRVVPEEMEPAFRDKVQPIQDSADAYPIY